MTENSLPHVHIQHAPGGCNTDHVWHCPQCPGDNPDNGKDTAICQWCNTEVQLGRPNSASADKDLQLA